ncbi:hypothetical protein HK104_008741, partial [Borealophlyctis nickersoniae]
MSRRNGPSKAPAAEPTINILDDEDVGNLRGVSGQGYAWEEEYKRSWDTYRPFKKNYNIFFEQAE